MYELENGDTTKLEFRNMIEFQDQISDIYTEYKTKHSNIKRSQSEIMEENCQNELSKSSRIPSHVFGIHNIGNTCFFNSTMQALNATRELVDYYVGSQDTYEDQDQLLSSKEFVI